MNRCPRKVTRADRRRGLQSQSVLCVCVCSSERTTASAQCAFARNVCATRVRARVQKLSHNGRVAAANVPLDRPSPFSHSQSLSIPLLCLSLAPIDFWKVSKWAARAARGSRFSSFVSSFSRPAMNGATRTWRRCGCGRKERKTFWHLHDNMSLCDGAESASAAEALTASAAQRRRSLYSFGHCS
jgi:hypothetical protein